MRLLLQWPSALNNLALELNKLRISVVFSAFMMMSRDGFPFLHHSMVINCD